MPATIEIGSLLDRSPEIKNNRPRIAGTGVTVRRIAQYNNLGFTAEEIVAKYGHITLAGVHAALAYYFANRQEIDDDLAADEAAETEFRKLPVEVR